MEKQRVTIDTFGEQSTHQKHDRHLKTIEKETTNNPNALRFSRYAQPVDGTYFALTTTKLKALITRRGYVRV